MGFREVLGVPGVPGVPGGFRVGSGWVPGFTDTQITYAKVILFILAKEQLFKLNTKQKNSRDPYSIVNSTANSTFKNNETDFEKCPAGLFDY